MSARVSRNFYLRLFSLVLALGWLPQLALAEDNAEREIGVEILEMCIDPETSNQAIFDYLLERNWEFVDLDEAETLVPPKDVDTFSPEQIFGFAYYAVSFGASHSLNRYDPTSNLEEFMGFSSRLRFFAREGRSITMAGPNDEVMAISFRHLIETKEKPEEGMRIKCSFSALRQSTETELFDVTPGEPTRYDFVALEWDNSDLTGPMVAYTVITAEAALLSDVFETEVPALVAFEVGLDLNAN